jgi:hypothetical protein
MLRFTHFCAIAFIVSRYLHRDWNGLKSMWLRPLVLCGQHSLPLFCVGVFLSFGAHWVLVQYSNSGLEQVIVAFAGFSIMTAVAGVLDYANKVPNLFVDAGLGEEPDPGTQPGVA